MRVLLAGGLACALCIHPGTAAAQRGATGPVAALNAEARALSDPDPEQSLAVARKALAAAREARDVRGEAEALNFIAYGYRSQSLLDLARQNALESIRLFAQEGDPYGEAQGHNTLGLIEADAGRFPDALEHHLRALEIRERIQDREGLAYTYNNLGNAYRTLGEYEKALQHHREGLALKVELGMAASEAYSHHNIGLVYFEMQDYPNALVEFQRGLEIRERLGDDRAVGVSLNAIGRVEARTDPAAALRTYDRALMLRRRTGDTRGEMATELNIGDVYRRMGDLTRATAAFQRALALGDALDAPLMRSNALRQLAEVEAARGNFRAAYDLQREHQTAREQLFNQENATRLQQLQVAHDADRQQRAIEMLERDRDLRNAELAQVRTARTALAVTAVLVGLSLALLAARYRLKRQSEARLRAQAAELSEALASVRTLEGLLPICAACKKIRDDNGYWTQVEAFVARHSSAEFTHSICPTCIEDLYPEHAGPS